MDHRICMIILLVCCCLAGTASADGPPVKPGKEGRFTVPGYERFPCTIYVPSDYNQEKPFPLILFMHGAGARPTSWPFKQATGGKGYVIIGLSYAAVPGGGRRGISSDASVCKAMVTFLKKTIAHAASLYKIHNCHVVLSGLSMGGWGVNYYGFHPDAKGLFHSYIIIAAGPMNRGPVDFSVAKGIPVLLLNGERDPNVRVAVQGRPALQNAGAVIQQVVIRGQGHVPATNTMSRPLSAFLAKHSYAGKITKMCKKAKSAEEEKRIGDAINMYGQALTEADQKKVELPDRTDIEKHVTELVSQGEKSLAEADRLTGQLKFKEALVLLEQTEKLYKGHKISDRAQSGIKVISRKKEENKAASDLLARADKAVESKQFVKGAALLRKVIKKYSQSPSAAEARKKIAGLKENPQAVKALKAAARDAKCRQYLNMAENFIQAGHPESALEYLDKVIEKYPDTEWAEQARKMKGKIR